jgi:hypothetical protein
MRISDHEAQFPKRLLLTVSGAGRGGRAQSLPIWRRRLLYGAAGIDAQTWVFCAGRGALADAGCRT